MISKQIFISSVTKHFPALHQQGKKNVCFSWNRIFGWILNDIVASLVIFLANIFILCPTAFHKEGEVLDIAHLGAITYTCIIWTVNCQIALVISQFNWIWHLIIWGSIFLWYNFLLAYAALPLAYLNTTFQAFSQAIEAAPVFWFITLIVAVVSLMPYFLYFVIQWIFYPMDDPIIQEMKYYKKYVTENQMGP